MWGELSFECGASCLGASVLWGELSWGELFCFPVMVSSAIPVIYLLYLRPYP